VLPSRSETGSPRPFAKMPAVSHRSLSGLDNGTGDAANLAAVCSRVTHLADSP
jgi:hypothetical protein